jgi:hypothetical protein
MQSSIPVPYPGGHGYAGRHVHTGHGHFGGIIKTHAGRNNVPFMHPDRSRPQHPQNKLMCGMTFVVCSMVYSFVQFRCQPAHN